MRIGSSHSASDGISRVSLKKNPKSHFAIRHEQGKDGILTTARRHYVEVNEAITVTLPLWSDGFSLTIGNTCVSSIVIDSNSQ